jgi:hypothetical protein
MDTPTTEVCEVAEGDRHTTYIPNTVYLSTLYDQFRQDGSHNSVQYHSHQMSITFHRR